MITVCSCWAVEVDEIVAVVLDVLDMGVIVLDVLEEFTMQGIGGNGITEKENRPIAPVRTECPIIIPS